MNQDYYRVRFYIGKSSSKHERFFKTAVEANQFHKDLFHAALISGLRVVVGNVSRIAGPKND